MEPTKEETDYLLQKVVEDVSHRYRHALPFDTSPYCTTKPNMAYYKEGSGETSKLGKDVIHKGSVILSTKRAFEDFEQTAAMMSNINYDEDEIGAAIVNSIRTGNPVMAKSMVNDEDTEILLRATERLRQGVVNAVNTARLDHAAMDKELVFDGWCHGDMVLEHIEIREER